jgi:hypothetical protein
MVTFLIVTAILSMAASLDNAVAVTPSTTRIKDFTAEEDSPGLATISGVLQYRNAAGDFRPINSSKVKFYWSTTVSNSTIYTYVGEIYTNDKTSGAEAGAFVFSWQHALEPGQYYIQGTYGPESWGNYTFNKCSEYASLVIRLRLRISVNKPTVSVGQGESATIAVSVDAINTNLSPSVSLSIENPTHLLADGINATFTRLSGSIPLHSDLRLDVSNVTRPGSYTVAITAKSDDGNSVSTTTLYVYVQQNTHTITVEIQGLPPDVTTSLHIDGSVIESMGTGTMTLTISNKTKSVSVLKEIISGDTLYLCEDYTKAADATGVDSFVFNYVTEYRLKISGDLPQNIVCNLVLKADDADKSDSEFKPAQGYNDFLPKDANVSFAISPQYITTTQVNYKFREWKERMTGQIMSVSNSTADGLFVVRLSRPLDLRAYYDKWTAVTIKTNLPSELATNLQIGLVGSEKKNVTVTGSVAYKAGEFLAGGAFECNIAQDQLVLYKAEGNIRYEFQGMSPPSPMSLDQHTTIYINYTSEYRVQVVSRFPDAVIQPPGGVGWYAPGQIATLQVINEAKDKYGIPYLFEKWTGAVSSNETIVSFPVVTPVDIEVSWKLNWIYLLTVGGGFLGVAVPSAIVVKKKVLVRVRWPKKSAFKKRDDSQGGLTDDDMQVYNYIMTKGGSLRMSEAAADLGMSREVIKESIEKLRKKELLH